MNTERRYFITVLVSGLLGLFHLWAIGNPFRNLLLSFTVFCVVFLGFWAWRSTRLRTTLLLPLTLALGFTIGAYYLSTTEVIKALGLPQRTTEIIRVEEFLFRPYFTNGHISLALDQSAVLNPSTLPGKILTEFLQLMYLSYYFWGFLIMIVCVALVFRDREKHRSFLMRFTSAWIGAYMLNFIFYLAIPVVGPESTLSAQYKNPLEGLWLAQGVHRWIDSQHVTIEDCFPSGHAALSWVTAFFAGRLNRFLGYGVGFCAAMVTVATVYLRYHYIVDVLAAVPLVWFALKWGEYDEIPRQIAT